MAAKLTKPLKIFYSYARKDVTLLDQLDGHLEVLKDSGIITTWSDRDMKPGELWKEKIHTQLDNSDIILLLISPSFLRSKLCKLELQQALQRRHLGSVHVIPITLRPSDWQDTPLADLQVLPTNGNPVTTWRNRDEAFQDIVKGIRDVVFSLLSEDQEDQELEDILFDRVVVYILEELNVSTLDYYIHMDEEKRGENVSGEIARWWHILVDIHLPHRLSVGWYGLLKSGEIGNVSSSGELPNGKTKEQWVAKGHVHTQEGHYNLALFAFAQAIRCDPNDAEIFWMKGKILTLLHRDEEAETAFAQASRLDPNFSPPNL